MWTNVQVTILLGTINYNDDIVLAKMRKKTQFAIHLNENEL